MLTDDAVAVDIRIPGPLCQQFSVECPGRSDRISENDAIEIRPARFRHV